MGSSFWMGDNSDTEEDEVGEESDSEEEEIGEGSKADDGAANKSGRYLVSESESDESDDQKRVVSAKDKLFQEMSSTVEQIKNAMKINDWVSLQDSYEKINK